METEKIQMLSVNRIKRDCPPPLSYFIFQDSITTWPSNGKESTCQWRRHGSMIQEDPLEKGMATLSNTLAWRIPWTEGPWGHKESDTTDRSPAQMSPQREAIHGFIQTHINREREEWRRN